MHVKVIPKLDTDSFFNTIIQFSARRGKSSTKNNKKWDKSCCRRTRVWRVRCGMEQRRDPRAHNSTNSQRENKLTGRVRRKLGTFGQWFQEGNVCSVGETINDGWCTVLSTTMFIVEIILNARPLTPVNWHVDDLDAFTPNQFSLCNKNIYLTYEQCNFAINSKIIRDWFREYYSGSLNNRNKAIYC